MTEPAANRKHLILDAACRAIARTGAAAVRVSDVAREAGVSTALVHYYFPSRADVIVQAFSHADDLADAVAEEHLAELASGRERVERLILTWAGDDPAIRTNWAVWNEMWQYAAHNDAARAMVADSHQRWLDQVAQLIGEGREDGSIRADVDVDGAARRLAACVDDWGRETLIAMRTPAGMRAALTAATAHELGPVPRARGRAA
ncbi:MAG TPA: TetR family transcriptional regulator C-terminal domain-containing protein [Gaiellales bacterium]|jgi:AcrR family transcriptional regulator|nr:TetR family transcriptional regulator C-terminal domain-containing protein [Gaiellales bacterium]